MNKDLLNIKKYYGERMSHLCRELFPTLLEQDGLLFNLIESTFAHSKNLYDDLIENKFVNNFKNFIYSLIDVETEDIVTSKTPKELLNEADYILYECKTEEDIQTFKKYYKETEKLCTFNGGRLNTYHVFFAVKKNVDDIKREDFKVPTRQDEYGTSVISIQFSRGENNTISIKNRYNHTVINPDATFSNNLENIIHGLTRAFEKEYNLNINQNHIEDFGSLNYVKANDGKYYKYNYEINNVYYCVDNIIIDNFEVINDYQEKEKYLLIDYFIIDLVNKKINLYDKEIDDSFVDRFNNIKIIEIIKDKITKYKKIRIVLENQDRIFIELDKNNRIIYYRDNVKQIPASFLYANCYLQEIVLDEVLSIDSYFLDDNTTLNSFNAPKLKIIGNFCMRGNEKLEKLILPEVHKIGNSFLNDNEILNVLYAPKLTFLGFFSLKFNKNLTSLFVPNLETLGGFILVNNKKARDLLETQCQNTKQTKIKNLCIK